VKGFIILSIEEKNRSS